MRPNATRQRGGKRSGARRPRFLGCLSQAFLKIGGKGSGFFKCPSEIAVQLLKNFDFVPKRKVSRLDLSDLSVEFEVYRCELSDKALELCFLRLGFR